MKFLITMILLCVALSYIAAEEIDVDKFHANVDECKEETDASDDDVARLLKHEKPNTPEGKCLKACLMKKQGVLDDKNHLVKEKLMEMMKWLTKGHEEKDKIIADIIDDCAEIKAPENYCEAADAYSECMMSLSKEKGLATKETE